MKLLLDQGLPRSTVAVLAECGVDAEHVGELGMAAASDAEILEAAIVRDAVVVSLDSDFHTLLALSSATRPSVIRIRIEGLKSPELAEHLLRVLAAIAEELERGAVASVTESQIRVRTLPIGAKPR
ncbi:DUF5615 family PIN-like protein [Pseudobythopirellula maris]|uniref:DUF5615 family PIN-like protein n=1 Tax=Pseudobythopirellula maris TaxID=2527991 RepID=UPI0011B7B096|nr:DUF5615 family PIN-like protein [Pseudobythopirellula maris]